MKNIMSRHNRGMLLAMSVLFISFMLGGASLAQAHDGYQDRDGYYHDSNGGYHRYGYHHHHHGYWNQQNGVRLWINVG